MEKIVEVEYGMPLYDHAVQFFWKHWGTKDNYFFYQDCIRHSDNKETDLPRFYVAVQDNHIIGSYALLRNELISRQDIFPWFACLYVNENQRGKQLGSRLLEHASQETYKKGYEQLYLSMDLIGYYEKYGWHYIDNGFAIDGSPTRIYKKTLHTI